MVSRFLGNAAFVSLVLALLPGCEELGALAGGGGGLELQPQVQGQLTTGLEVDVRVFAHRDGVDTPCADRPLSTCSSGESYFFDITGAEFDDTSVGEVLEITQPPANSTSPGVVRVRAVGPGVTRLRVEADVRIDGVVERKSASWTFEVLEVARAPFHARCNVGPDFMQMSGSLGPDGEALPTFGETVLLNDPRAWVSVQFLPFASDGEPVLAELEPVSDPPEILDPQALLSPGPFVISSPVTDQQMEGEVVTPEAIDSWRYVGVMREPRRDGRMLAYLVPATVVPLHVAGPPQAPQGTVLTPMPFAGARPVCGDFEGLPGDVDPVATSLTPEVCTIADFTNRYDHIRVDRLIEGHCVVEVSHSGTTDVVEFDILDIPVEDQ